MNFEEIRQRVLTEINPYIDTLIDRWEGFNRRDQLVILLLSALMLASLMFALVLYPVTQYRKDVLVRYDAKLALNTWMKSVAPSLKDSSKGGSKKVNSGQAMLGVINSTAASQGLKIKRLQPEGDKNLRVWFEDMPFNNLMMWLSEIERAHQITVDSVNIDAQKVPGIVNAKLVLSGAF